MAVTNALAYSYSINYSCFISEAPGIKRSYYIFGIGPIVIRVKAGAHSKGGAACQTYLFRTFRQFQALPGSRRLFADGEQDLKNIARY